MEGRALRSLVDAFKFTLTYPDWCKQKGIVLGDFLEWMQVCPSSLDRVSSALRWLTLPLPLFIAPQPTISGQKVDLETFVQHLEKVPHPSVVPLSKS